MKADNSTKLSNTGTASANRRKRLIGTGKSAVSHNPSRASLAEAAIQNIIASELHIIRQAFPRDMQIARVLGVSPSQLTRWTQGQMPDSRNRARIRMLASNISLLLECFEPSVIPGWFRSPSVDGKHTPAELLRTGQWNLLREHVEASVQGAFS